MTHFTTKIENLFLIGLLSQRYGVMT